MEWKDAIEKYKEDRMTNAIKKMLLRKKNWESRKNMTNVLKIIDERIADKELQIRDLNDLIYELQCLKHKIELTEAGN